MTLKEIVDFFNRNKNTILIFSLVFAIIGAVLYFYMPQRYEAKGTLYIARKIDPAPFLPNSEVFQEPVFTYEGYYAQQNALSYTSTLIGLIESDDIKSGVLDELSLGVDRESLSKLGRSIRAKKKAPQLIEVTVKSWNTLPPETVWKSLVANVIDASETISGKGDPNLVVVQISEEPLVKETYRNLGLNILVGFGIGMVLSSFVLAGKEYFKNV